MPEAEIHPWLELDIERARSVIVRFLARYAERTDRAGYVVGLSGGIDSAVTAALCVEAVGAGNVDVVTLPGPTSSPEDAQVAAEVASHLGLELDTVGIAPAAKALEDELGVTVDRVVRANLQARLRMTVLYARAQATDRLVAGTGNKSELMTGYFTKHGDGGVDVEPIGDLYKTQVGRLARDLALPDRVVERAPSAGLWAGQRDEDELGMPYATLDVILAGCERQADDGTISRQTAEPLDEVQRVRSLVRSTWHKRNPPPVPKLGWRTPLVDWREPTA